MNIYKVISKKGKLLTSAPDITALVTKVLPVIERNEDDFAIDEITSIEVLTAEEEEIVVGATEAMALLDALIEGVRREIDELRGNERPKH